jgi:hypothetical protein
MLALVAGIIPVIILMKSKSFKIRLSDWPLHRSL